ncbi:MAG TPA: protein-disulfide reductase DsbD domain-containing protein, partial [Candidatus Binatia bacterium]|nr:protein-disulfide reductase DsbD domain-containing protein [Candidatus Binatia bacterium]
SSQPGTWYDWQRKTFRDGKFSVDYEQTLFGGAGPMHDWQFRVEADGYEPAVSRVIRDAERGTNIAFELKPQAAPRIDATAPSEKKRVTAALALQPASAAPGETVTAFIKVRIAEGHWIYALDKSGSENLPTRIEAKLPREIEQDGPWRGPEPKLKPDGARTIAGEVLFSSRFLIEGYARQAKHKLPFKFEFQVCNDLLCWPPETIDIEAELEVVKPR